MRVRQFDSESLAFFMGRLKSHLRITSGDLDDELLAKLAAAIENSEHFIGRIILKSTLIDTIPYSSTVALCRPLIQVDGMKVDGTAVNMEEVKVDVFAGTATLPQSVTGESVEVTYEAGMPQPPADIVNAVLLLAASLFSNPLDSVETLPRASMRLLRPHRNYGM